jgi:L-alanine-DL-glutamate epimerase-like enolase superfamily enzyme
MKITNITVHAVSRPVRAEFAIVSAAGSHPVSDFAQVEITADNGVSGIGEASVTAVWSGETQASVIHAISNILAPVLMGRDPQDVAAAAEVMDRALVDNPFTKAAVEMALLDLAGKSLGVPAFVLLGGRRRTGPIGLKFSIGAFKPAKAAQVALRAAEMGLKAVKIKVGLDVATDIERVEAVRRELGEDFPIGVDANGGWTEAETVAALPQLERLGVMVLEQPLRRGDFLGSRRIRNRTAIPVMLDESIFTSEHALEAVRQSACDLISIYPGKNGGILKSLAIANLAAVAGMECIIGSNLEMETATAAMVTLAATAPALCERVNHDIIGPLYYDGGSQIQYESGCVVQLTGPGLGV